MACTHKSLNLQSNCLAHAFSQCLTWSEDKLSELIMHNIQIIIQFMNPHIITNMCLIFQRVSGLDLLPKNQLTTSVSMVNLCVNDRNDLTEELRTVLRQKCN